MSRRIFKVKMTKLVMTALLLGVWMLAAMGTATAQVKIRYINSQNVLDNYPEWQDVQKQLEDQKKAYEEEFNQMQTNGQQLLQEIQNQSLLLSPDKKASKEAELQQLQVNLERFYYEKLGPQGELFKKNQALSEPILEKINTVIKQVGEDEGYDVILDSVQGLLYAKPELDITNRVLEELGKLK